MHTGEVELIDYGMGGIAVHVGGTRRWQGRAWEILVSSTVRDLVAGCREAGLTARQRYEASEALHAEKQASGKQEHMSYEELLAWLRERRQR